MNARPNILWIVTTQWRAQACGYAGDPNARTPHIDALAAESVNYTQAVTPHPFGPFARAALLTGRPSQEVRVREYFDPLPPETRTIAHDLRERGYATAFFGKWGVGRRDPRMPLVSAEAARVVIPPGGRGGFGIFDGFEGGFQLNDPWFHGAASDVATPVRIPGYQSAVLCERFLAWQSEAAKAESPASGTHAPWFAVLSLEAPHPPYDAPADGIGPRDPAALVLPPNVPRGGEAEARARRELAGYYAHIEATDRALGTLLRPGMLPAGTIVVFTSVHGDMHGAHGLFRKGWPHEESIRVPLLIRGVGAVRRDDSPMSLLDLPRLTRAWAEAAADGVSEVALHAAAVPVAAFATISMPSVVALPHQCDRWWRGIRTAERKLILGPDGAPWLYFDLKRDPGELQNLAQEASRRREIDELRMRLAESQP